MDLKTFPAESGKIFLADISPEFAELEGDVPVDDRVWVVIKQATQSDNMRRADLYTKRETKYSADAAGVIDSFSRVYTENVLRRRMEEVRLTLKDIGNLVDDGKPVFPKMPARDIPQKEFEELWGKLPDPRIAEAVHAAVLQVNADWGMPGE
jgi:hypothetical protein